MGIENLLYITWVFGLESSSLTLTISQLFQPMYKDIIVSIKLKANAINANEINVEFKPVANSASVLSICSLLIQKHDLKEKILKKKEKILNKC